MEGMDEELLAKMDGEYPAKMDGMNQIVHCLNTMEVMPRNSIAQMDEMFHSVHCLGKVVVVETLAGMNQKVEVVETLEVKSSGVH